MNTTANDTLILIRVNGEAFAAVDSDEIARCIRLLKNSGRIEMVRRPAAVALAEVEAASAAMVARLAVAKALDSEACRSEWTWGSTPCSSGLRRRAQSLRAP